MNSVSAVSMPFASDGAREALSNPGVAGIAAMAVEGFGRQQDHTESSRTAGYAVDFFPNTEVEVAVDDALPGPVAGTAGSATRPGDHGPIFVFPLQQVIRVRTGESGPGAL